MSRPSNKLIAALAGGGLAFAGFTYWWAQHVEPYLVELTTPTLLCPRLPAELDGLRILFLADNHTDRWTRREEEVLRVLKDLPVAPDVIVWGGDFLFHFGDTAPALRFVRAVQELLPGIPSFGILGNAEHKLTPKSTETLIADLEALGVHMMMNRWEPLTVRGTEITVAGVDDPYYGYDDLPAALRGAPEDRFTLFLAHSPQIVYRAARAGVDVMLSGHTHGGQVRLPLLGALRAQNPLGRKMDCGLFTADRLRPLLNGRDIGPNLQLYVTRGIGVAPTWRLYWLRPRLLCRPEIALIQLKTPDSTDTTAMVKQ